MRQRTRTLQVGRQCVSDVDCRRLISDFLPLWQSAGRSIEFWKGDSRPTLDQVKDPDWLKRHSHSTSVTEAVVVADPTVYLQQLRDQCAWIKAAACAAVSTLAVIGSPLEWT